MPAVTRSQKKMNVNVMDTMKNVEKQAVKYNANAELLSSKPNIKVETCDLHTRGFVKYINNAIIESQHYVKTGKYFENLRILTEIYYYISESFDKILLVDGMVRGPKFQRLINVMYLKGVELLSKVTKKQANTSEDHHIMNCYFEQLVQTQSKLKLYSKETRSKPIINYAGMDTIEPLNELDAITNIWMDDTIDEDPDYEYESDEDEDEDEEFEDEEFEELEDEDEDEDEEFEEDEDEDEDEDEEFEVHKVASNHLRFVY